MERAIMCPQCNAPLTPHQFARSIICPYCGATVRLDEGSVSAARFREAFRAWNSPEFFHTSSLVSIGNGHWSLDKCIAHGAISDVYSARRARWPTELVILKLLRDPAHVLLFDNEWDTLQTLQHSDAPGAEVFTRLIPQPVIHGNISSGSLAGNRVSIFRREGGFTHTFKDVIQAYPNGIPPQASVWVWRRILEILSFLHTSGMAHGAVLPEHILVQEHEHGVRLVGYSSAGKLGAKLPAISEGSESFYPKTINLHSTLPAGYISEKLDLVMSARCIAAILGGDPETGFLPASVPAKLADIVQRIARLDYADKLDLNAWTIHDELGIIAREVFGPPQFMPIVMPSGPQGA